MSANDQQQDPAAATQQPSTQAASTTPNSNSENLACQWQGCGERCTSAEALYDHVCERHVGRKSTNNLNLTCQWGTCRTTTVKRDHITSHIRVHVPLKPHKCEFCGKAFKRPQDLKKHVKTHADDSVILRSPEPSGGARPANGGVYNVPNGKTPGYYETPVTGQGYNSHVNAPYYQPQAPQHQTSSYGNVYYMNQGADIGNQAAYEARKRGYEALDQFFADLKRRNFDAASYAAVGQRLMALQGLQLPDVMVPSYQPAPVMVAAGGHGGHHGTSLGQQTYSLPSMPNLRTKSDLTTIDQFLEQMQATVYENDTQVAAAGVGQPGAHFVAPSIHYRSSHSPPSVQLPSSHQTANASILGNNPQSHSPHGTPALTPPSSANSYTSGHSPGSHTSHHYSPQSSTGGMYPTLPATTSTSHDAMDTSYSTSNAPTSTLGSLYDNDPRHRYGGSMLQRSAPGPSSAEMADSAMSDVSSATPPARSPKGTKSDIASSLIDPALGGHRSPHTQSSRSGSVHGDEKNVAADKAEEQWVENIRLIEALRHMVRERLEKREYVGDDGVIDDEKEQMEGVQQEGEAAEKKEEEVPAYPVLRV